MNTTFMNCKSPAHLWVWWRSRTNPCF